MPSISVGNVDEWEVRLDRIEQANTVGVRRLFDAAGSETFDPSVTVEVETAEGDLHRLVSGDRLLISASYEFKRSGDDNA